MYVFDLNVIRRTERLSSVSLHFYKRRTRWPISYALNEIYSSHRLSSLSAQIQLEPESYGWQSFPIGDLIQRQLDYLRSSGKSDYFGLTFKPTVTTNAQRRSIIDLEKFSVHHAVHDHSFQWFERNEFLRGIHSEELRRRHSTLRTIRGGCQGKDSVIERMRVDVERRPFFARLRLRRSSERPWTNDSSLLLSNWTSSTSIADSDTCSLKPLVIDFSDLGFSSWMMEPKSFMSNLCSGSCQTKVISSTSTHSHVNVSISSWWPTMLSSNTFCNAWALEMILICRKPVAYRHDTRLSRYSTKVPTTTTWFVVCPNMIVDECHCRWAVPFRRCRLLFFLYMCAHRFVLISMTNKTKLNLCFNPCLHVVGGWGWGYDELDQPSSLCLKFHYCSW